MSSTSSPLFLLAILGIPKLCTKTRQNKVDVIIVIVIVIIVTVTATVIAIVIPIATVIVDVVVVVVVIIIIIIIIILSITKFSIVSGSPRAYLSRNRRAITWVSSYRCPI